MSNETIPLNLFKANLELQLRLQRLVQENGQQWLENATRAGKDGIAESGAEIESLLKAQNWQELATLPARVAFSSHCWPFSCIRRWMRSCSSRFALKRLRGMVSLLMVKLLAWVEMPTRAVKRSGHLADGFAKAC